MIGWLNNWQYAAKVPTAPWRGQMTVPRRLQMRRLAEGLRLVQAPVEAIERLHGAHFTWRGADVRDLNRALQEKFRGNSFELRSTVSGASGEFGWNLLAGQGKRTTVGYANGQLFLDRTQSGVTDFSKDFPARVLAPLAIGSAPLELTILVDRSTVEVFAQGGRVAMTSLVYPVAGANWIEFYSGDGKARAIVVDGWELESAWK
jgi:sucrose-6-phosphate hydrolase SacC (GH32 family)